MVANSQPRPKSQVPFASNNVGIYNVNYRLIRYHYFGRKELYPVNRGPVYRMMYYSTLYDVCNVL